MTSIDLAGPNGIGYALATFILGIVNYIVGGAATVIPPLQGLADWLRGPDILTVVAHLISTTVMVLLVSAINLIILLWFERKIAARMQDRYGLLYVGPVGLFQAVADGMKLFQKENITPRAADWWMFHASPAILATSSLAAFAVIPFSETFWVANVEFGLLLILAAFSIAPLGILVGGWAANNKYTLIGGLRSAAMMMSYEIPLILSVVPVVMVAGSLNPVDIVNAQQGSLAFGLPNWFILGPLFFSAVLFFIAMNAEIERLPFDLPEAEAELVEGWTTEFGAMRFGLIFMIKWVRSFAAAALIVVLFLGGWLGPTITVAGVALPPQEIWFFLKTYAVFAFFVWVNWSVPRVRIDQILSIGWRRLVPFSLFLIFLTATLKVAGVWFSGA
jgi:NADH-quinone oxidoreductase subunit H